MFAVFFKADVCGSFTHNDYFSGAQQMLESRTSGRLPPCPYDSFDTNKSMICMARILDPALCSPPAMFIRQPGSHITTVSAPLARISLTLFSIIARLTSG